MTCDSKPRWLKTEDDQQIQSDATEFTKKDKHRSVEACLKKARRAQHLSKAWKGI